MLGRVFTASEAQDLTQTVVISDAFWKRRFNRDPQVLGKTLKISGVLSTIVGVMPPSFGSFYGAARLVGAPSTPRARAIRNARIIG